MANLPYIVYGTIVDSSSNAVTSTKVTIRNESTSELITYTTNSSGKYQMDIGNLASGYRQDDRITVYCSTGNERNDSSFLVSDGTHTVNLALEIIEDSDLIYYTNVQNIWDELGDKTSSDISAHRVVKAIQRAESEIEEQTYSAWREITVTEEILDFNQETSYKSPEQLYYIEPAGRTDYMNPFYEDSIKLERAPIVSVTSLYTNSAGAASTDSWTELDEQSGSGGDFITYKDEGIIKFINKVPRYGKRSIKITYVYGHSSVPKSVERLTILLSVRDIVLSKISSSNFDNQDLISVDGLTVAGGMKSSSMYLDTMDKEIDRLWKVVGSFSSRVA